MIAVSDTSPLNYLVLIGLVDSLPLLFDLVVIPSTVQRELLHAKAPDAVKAWAGQLPDWVQIRNPHSAIPPRGLHPGETDAIALFEEMLADRLLVDERDASRIAMHRGIPTVSTLAILAEAAARDLIDLTLAIARLRATNFRASAALFEHLLQQEEQRRKGTHQ